MLTKEQRAELKANSAHPDWVPALLSALEEAETAYDTTYEVWQRTELENQLLRKQLAEAQAILKTREQSYVGVVADHCDRILWRGHYYSISSILAINTAIAEAVEPYKRDAERYQYLKGCVDIADDGDNDSEWWELHFEYKTGCNLDEAIDAALAVKEGK